MTPILLTATLLVPTNTSDLLAEAETQYHAGLEVREDSARAKRHFARSADAFEQSWEYGVQTPDVARNLAQARLLSGDVGRSIRDYRRGLRLSPYDRDLQQGLEHVRAQVGNREPSTVPQSHQSSSMIARLGVPVPRLFLCVMGVAAVGWFLLARAWLMARGALAIAAGAIILAAIGASAGLYWEDRRVREEWAESAAVVTSPTELFAGNSEEYHRRIDAKIPAGVEMRILGRRGGWVHVEMADGTIGWVRESRVATTD